MIRTLLSAILLAGAPAAFAQLQPDVIYGEDDRRDLYQVQDSRVLRLADSTVGLFAASDVAVEGGRAKLSTRHYGEGYRLCPDEPFFEQRSGAFCSGSLVAPDIIMTAGHCLRSQSACERARFVFGFGIKAAGAFPHEVPASEVYSCAQLIHTEEHGRGADWALVRLDRPVTGHAPLRLDAAPLAEKHPLFVIGHPAGLPTKVAGGAWVRDYSPNGYFKANLDTYGGNSGSAVFDARTGAVVGILVRGEQDYVWRGSCRVSKVCSDEGCAGEDVTKASAVRLPAGAPFTPMRLVSTEGMERALERAQASLR